MLMEVVLAGGNMGCVQPRIGDGWVSPGYHTPLMFLDTDINMEKSV